MRYSLVAASFIDFVLEFGFTQLVDFPTRDQNILDVFFTNHPTHEYICKPLAGLGDHEIVYITSAVGIELQRPIPRHIYLWHKADFDRIRYLANNMLLKSSQRVSMGVLASCLVRNSSVSAAPHREC